VREEKINLISEKRLIYRMILYILQGSSSAFGAEVFIYSSSSIIAPCVRRTSLTVLVCLSVYRARGERKKERAPFTA